MYRLAVIWWMLALTLRSTYLGLVGLDVARVVIALLQHVSWHLAQLGWLLTVPSGHPSKSQQGWATEITITKKPENKALKQAVKLQSSRIRNQSVKAALRRIALQMYVISKHLLLWIEDCWVMNGGIPGEWLECRLPWRWVAPATSLAFRLPW